MTTPIIATKLHIPTPRPAAVARPRLIEQLAAGRGRKLTLISAPAGFGKTTLVAEWLAGRGRPAAWLSLDEGDHNPARFLSYLIASLQTVTPGTGESVLPALQSPQPPATELVLTALLNDLAALSEDVVLVLDDYHRVDAPPVDEALNFLLQHLPPRLHLVIATREDPPLPLARLRAQSQLSELRVNDLRFTPAEAAQFLNQAMGLKLAADDVDALEKRTEGWIAGLQLAALSMQGQQDVGGFIQSFTGSHRFVMDYLLEEVLHQQAAEVQTFLLRTSILERMCGPLCDAVLGDETSTGQTMLETLETANLFIVPLDNQRRWYRYHHLFAELLRQRLQHESAAVPGLAELHIRASQWYEANDLYLEAFQHAAAAGDIERAHGLIKGDKLPLHSGVVTGGILEWLAGLPRQLKDERPALWATDAALTLITGQTGGVAQKLQAAEDGLARFPPDEHVRNLQGQIAAARATLAVTRYDAPDMLVQARRALEHLAPENLPFRATANWVLGVAYAMQRDYAAAEGALREVVRITELSGDTFHRILALDGLGQVQEANNQLHTAAESFRQTLQLVHAQPLPNACEPHLGLARVHYEWNELAVAEAYGRRALELARQYEQGIDRFVLCELMLARLHLARGENEATAAALARVEPFVQQHQLTERLAEVAAVKILLWLGQGDIEQAADLAARHDLPHSRARVALAQGDPSTALVILEPLHRQAADNAWPDDLLRALVLEALAHQVAGDTTRALELLAEALAMAEPEGFIRTFVDEGPPMARLLEQALAADIAPAYVRRLLAAFSPADKETSPLAEPLSEREIEILRHIAAGLTNQDIADRLVLSLYTVKAHARNIYGKLGVSSRTQAVAAAREMGILG